MSREELIVLCPPYPREKMDMIQRNGVFLSPYENEKQYNGMSFTILNEIYEDTSREAIGNECSAAWINEAGELCSDRYFNIRLEDGTEDGTEIMAELEELNGWYLFTGQIPEIYLPENLKEIGGKIL